MTNEDDAEEKYSSGVYAVSFLDVLGQREAIRAIPAFSIADLSQASREKIFTDSIAAQYYVRKQVGVAVREAAAAPSAESIAELPPDQREFAETITPVHLGKFSFSDTLVHYVETLRDKPNASLHAVITLIIAVGTGWLVCLARKTPTRGAVDAGFSIISSTGEIYGPAFLSAYELEQMSGYPRIVVGENLITLVESYSSETDAFTRHLYEQCMSMIVYDKDGKRIVNIHAELFKVLIKNHQEFISDAIAFARNEANRFESCSNQKLAKRYQDLVASLALVG